MSTMMLANTALAASNEQIDLLWDEFSVNERIDDNEAFKILTRIIDKEPKNIRALKSATYLKLRQGKNEDALIFTEKDLKRNPDDES